MRLFLLSLISISLGSIGYAQRMLPIDFANRKLVYSDAGQRQLAKDYFLCTCISAGFKDDTLAATDHMVFLYRDYLSFAADDVAKLDSFAQRIIDTSLLIRAHTSYPDGDKTLDVFYTCIEHYKSEYLHSLINTFPIPKRRNEDD